MFYCDDCKDKNDWPESIGKSRGKCEMCEKSAICNDVPSSRLPIKTGIEKLDELMSGGYKKGELTIIMAPPYIRKR